MDDTSMKKSQRNAKNRRGRVNKCPVEIGKEYDVEITETTPNGVGMTRIKGFLTLVNDSQLGDHITVTITKTDPLSAEAEIVT